MAARGLVNGSGARLAGRDSTTGAYRHEQLRLAYLGIANRFALHSASAYIWTASIYTVALREWTLNKFISIPLSFCVYLQN